ncbi:hypothetical protein TIFTF001_021901 [Ficus carica]|uniref:Small ribosomal subunit protein uS14m n=1 Tax=Ficus carica TaxID=3494 RepID=A0AA88AGR0_FICCA|nr:hypothetical protein TIFTF001_021901 [Ficus carica]
MTQVTEMGKENANIRDNHRRQLAARFELQRKLYKAMANDTTLPDDVRQENRMKLSRLPRNSSFTRIRNRCVYTGRARGIVSLFRMSRIVFRDLANKKLLDGVLKASW